MSRRIKLAAVLSAAAATVTMLTGGAGAASSPVASKAAARSAAGKAAARHGGLLRRADFTTVAGAKAYLHAIGVNSAGVVIERGPRNYAGPSCPGAGWTCASTARPVVQVTAPGGRNLFSCAGNACTVVQTTARAARTSRSLAAVATTNTAKCIKTTGVTQTCTILQPDSGSSNVAIVVEASASTGLTQTASFTASITQQTTGTSATNTACVSQNVLIDGSTKSRVPVSVTLDAHQSIAINQDSATGGNTVENATLSGNCDSSNPLTQSQTLTSGVSSPVGITQNENAANSGPNVSLDIEQNQSSGFFGTATGANNAAFSQASNLLAVASTPAGPVSQTQSSVNGGILATVNQDSRDVSTANAKQTERQCEDAVSSGAPSCTAADPPSYSLTQTQFGPIRKGAGLSTQTGNAGDTFAINQSSTQNNDTGNNQSNVVQGDCVTDGNCTVSQTTNVDGTTTTNTQSGQTVITQTTCSGSTCTSGNGGTLTTLPTGLSVSNTDVGEFGTGGMRGTGTGAITVSGVTGPVTHAFLYWNGPTNSTDPNSNATVTFNGTSVTGTNIGTASSNCWDPPYTNGQSYRADVTTLVSGNATYALSNFIKRDPVTNDITADVNGVALIVFYNDGDFGNDRNVVIWNGNDSNFASGTDPAGWDETINGVQYPGSGPATLDFVVSDGQSFPDAALVVNNQTIAGPGSVFDGNTGPNYSGNPQGVTGSLWDVKSFGITNLLTTGSNNLHITTGFNSDCLSLVVAAANVPASAAPVIP